MPEDKKEAEETHAYTPGLKIKKSWLISKDRILPIPGKVLVNKGDTIKEDVIVAETLVPGDPEVVSAIMKLGITPDALPELMVKQVGDKVEKGEVIAQYNFLLGLFKRYVHSPIDGTIETVSNSTGQIILRNKDIPVQVNAYIPGKIVDVKADEGVTIETQGAFIQGIFGIGGERQGTLKVLVDGPSDAVTVDHIKPEHKGMVLIGGSFISIEALRKAVDVGVAGIVVGGMDSGDLMTFMGTDIGVAITGEEEYGTTLIVTEGFGEMAMHTKTFNIFKENDGSMVSMNGATQIRAGVIRPEIIIPHEGTETSDEDSDMSHVGMISGTPLRIIRKPHFGKICTLVSLPVELQKVDSGSYVRVLEAELEDGTRVIVPRANVEMIEE